MRRVVGVPVRVHSRAGDDLGICHMPHPVRVGDLLELSQEPILLLRVVELVETDASSPLAVVKVAPASVLVP